MNMSFFLVHQPIISNFQWLPNTTPASSLTFLITTILTYLISISTLSFLMSFRKNPLPFLRAITTFHNLFLLLLSFLMALSTSLSASSTLNSFTHLFCFPKPTDPKGPIFFWAYVFYLSKIFEFTDTVILILKKKPLTFLHVYHHSVVVVMCYLWLQASQSLMVIALVTNAGVHTLMYGYYLLSGLGWRPKWKRLVTNCQITQFVFSFLVSGVMLWMHFNGGGGCSGVRAWGFNAVFNGSLLILFMNFHGKTYKRRDQEDGDQRIRKKKTY